jgi:hypothetical protein
MNYPIQKEKTSICRFLSYDGGGSFSNEYLKIYCMCKEFHCLPYEGGYFDQPAKWIEAFER